MSHNFPGNPYAGREPRTETDGIMSALDTLSYEQRTANLIAYLERVDASLSEAIPTADLPNIRRDVHEEIAARLGLRKVAS